MLFFYNESECYKCDTSLAVKMMITCFLRWFKTFYIFLSTRVSTPFINTLVLFNYQIRLSGGYKQNDKDDLDTRQITDHKIKKNKA